MIAYAYVNYGRWVADCPAGCNSAEELRGTMVGVHNGQTRFRQRDERMYCRNCHVIADIVWPKNEQEIWNVLMQRPNEMNRNWYPPDHLVGSLLGYPNGQSIDELKQETIDNCVITDELSGE